MGPDRTIDRNASGADASLSRAVRSAAGLPDARRTLELRQRVRDDAYGSPQRMEELAWRIYRSGDL